MYYNDKPDDNKEDKEDLEFDEYFNYDGIWVKSSVAYSNIDYIIKELNFKPFSKYLYFILEDKTDGCQYILRNKKL